MDLDTGQWIVIGLCGVLIAGYIGGYTLNRRMAEDVVVWLHGGLKRWGRLSTGGRLGGMTTGGRLYVKEAATPFQTIEILFLLAPRENLIFWIVDLIRGRGDLLIVKLNLRTKPGTETAIEAGFHRDREFQKALDKATVSALSIISGGLEIAQLGKNPQTGERVRAFLERYEGMVTRLTIAHQEPHLTLRARLKPLLKCSAEEFFTALGELSG